MLTNKPELFESSCVLDPGLSDHAVICGIMKDIINYHTSKVMSFRNYAAMSESDFQHDIATAPWHVIYIFDSLDDKQHYFAELLSYIVNEHIPLQKKKVSARDVSYMTEEWKAAIREKRKAAKKFANERTPEN